VIGSGIAEKITEAVLMKLRSLAINGRSAWGVHLPTGPPIIIWPTAAPGSWSGCAVIGWTLDMSEGNNYVHRGDVSYDVVISYTRHCCWLY